MTMDYGLTGLLLVSFLAATVLPLSSEMVLITLFWEGSYTPLTLWIFATLGNVGGSIVNWYLGKYFLSFQNRSWFPLNSKSIHRAQKQYQKFGQPSLLLAWLPVVGDPLTFVAGLFQTPLLPFIFLVTLGKGGRYLVILWTLQG